MRIRTPGEEVHAPVRRMPALTSVLSHGEIAVVQDGVPLGVLGVARVKQHHAVRWCGGGAVGVAGWVHLDG